MTNIAGTLEVSATGTDQNDVSSTAGSGALVAGDAADGTTSDTSAVSASVGGGGILSAGTVEVTANNNSTYMPEVSSVNAAAVGASGANATNTDAISAMATVNPNTVITASSAVDITAQNTFTETVPANASSVSAGAGGLLNGTAAVSKSTLNGNATVTIGGGVLIEVETPTATGTGTPGIFLVASSVLDTDDQVSLSAGGAIAGAGTNSTLTATLLNKVVTNSSAAAHDTFMTNDNIGIGTYTDVTAATTSEASTFGVLGTLAAAIGSTTVTSNQTVALAPYTNLTAMQDINLTAGDDPIPGENVPTTMTGDSDAQSYARGFVGVPVATATTRLNSNATLSVATNDVIESGKTRRSRRTTASPSRPLKELATVTSSSSSP